MPPAERELARILSRSRLSATPASPCLASGRLCAPAAHFSCRSGCLLLQVWTFNGDQGDRDIQSWHDSSKGTLIMTYEEFKKVVKGPRKRKAAAAALDGPASTANLTAAGGAESGAATAGAAAALLGLADAETAAADTEPTDTSAGQPARRLTSAEMLTSGPEVVVVDEGHIIKNAKVGSQPFSLTAEFAARCQDCKNRACCLLYLRQSMALRAPSLGRVGAGSRC
jgi:hypothetical protein